MDELILLESRTFLLSHLKEVIEQGKYWPATLVFRRHWRKGFAGLRFPRCWQGHQKLSGLYAQEKGQELPSRSRLFSLL